MAIQVFVADEQSDEPVVPERWRRLALAVLEERGVAAPAELNILFVDEGSIASLNEHFLGKTGGTDVLSFSIEDEIDLPGPPGGRDAGTAGPGRSPLSVEGAPLLLGDVVICPAVAARNAGREARPYEDELALLVVHGILHLLGMDHEDHDEAEAMEALERALLARHHDGEIAAT